VPDANSPHGTGGFLFAPRAGTFEYPTDPVYANNAADLVELRVKSLGDVTAFRVTLNSLKDPAKTAFTIALGSSAAAVSWPHGAGVSSPAQLLLTVHGTTAELLDASGTAKSPAPTASVDLARRQVEVRVRNSAWDPGTGKVRMTIGVGLWDTAKNAYLAPSPGAPSETAPGGGSPAGTAIVNVGPRTNKQEDMPQPSQYGGGATIGDAAAGAAVQGAWWREKQQATALTTGDVSAFSAEVDFGRLLKGTDDDSGVPKTGALDRILASRHAFGQGFDPSKVCFDLASSFSAGAKCVGRYVGQLQPYALYVPSKPQPRDGYGLTLLLHSLSANYNQYLSSKNQSQLGDRGPGTLVVTPAGRGPDGFYAGMAEADTFEAWADVARHYALDPDWTVVTGYSMGGFGTYRMLARWPDLFARGFSVVGIPGSADDQLASLRNTPIMAWNADADELVPIDESEQAVKDLTAAGLRFSEQLFGASDHLTLATNDEYGPGAQWLGTHRVDRDPPHVSFVMDPSEDSAAAGTVADHAYWTSGLAVRDAKRTGTIDIRSEGFGVGDPKVKDVAQGAGTLDGGAHGPMPYAVRTQDWESPPAAAKADRLVVKATNLAGVVVDTRRARVSCAPQLAIESDGPLDLRLDCPAIARSARACDGGVTVALPRVRGRRVTLVTVTRRGARVARLRGRDVRRVTVPRVSDRAFSLRIYLHTSGKKTRRVVVQRRVAKC
jgi:pimeloyl-ACP methyl ester carboxylesterase